MSANRQTGGSGDGDDGGGWTPRGEAAELVSDPRGYILAIFVGGILSGLTAAVGFVLDGLAAGTSALRMSGSAVAGSIVTIQTTVVELVVVPLEVMDGVAASSGPFAPLVVALTFTLVAAISAGLVWGTDRVVRFL